jgi:hypothetical protein
MLQITPYRNVPSYFGVAKHYYLSGNNILIININTIKYYLCWVLFYYKYI